ncbi:hypothetical protein CTAYLR_009060 [Chrysophaeum taylorii]|uniref:acetyl-CoA C-acetyltransferase n=1 Tax=Chrysophaeum taylorii TaxID=2483200 RepID=A0AAD7UM53_9STRA|nr:hypothetical protein CTAYLR_009060 [Chrysophaeum taylorii]
MFGGVGDLAPVIIGYARTPIGSFNGALRSLSAVRLGSIAMREAVRRSGVRVEDVGEVFMGNVLSAGVGQAPATQAVIGAGLGESIPSTTVNKVCASGMKAVMFGAQALALGQAEVVVCGGMESMSNVPHYLPNSRSGFRLGDAKLLDGCVLDGLWDPYADQHMGKCAEMLSKELNISREDQDTYAELSYERAKVCAAYHREHEIVAVEVAQKKGSVTISEDEEPKKGGDLTKLKPAFQKDDGTVTAGNASSLNDGAAALVLATKKFARDRGLDVLCEIIAFADAQRDPVHFTIAPALAVPAACERAGMSHATDVDLFEINEAFSIVALANAMLLDIDPVTMLNLFGGAVSLGHPIGASGARITGSLAMALANGRGTTGVAAICNGGGGASAIVLRR